jgi:hypothetical protein
MLDNHQSKTTHEERQALRRAAERSATEGVCERDFEALFHHGGDPALRRPGANGRMPVPVGLSAYITREPGRYHAADANRLMTLAERVTGVAIIMTQRSMSRDASIEASKRVTPEDL